MKLLSCYTPSHSEIMNEFFLPSIPKGFELELLHIADIKGGDMCSKDWRIIKTSNIKLGLDTYGMLFGF